MSGGIWLSPDGHQVWELSVEIKCSTTIHVAVDEADEEEGIDRAVEEAFEVADFSVDDVEFRAVKSLEGITRIWSPDSPKSNSFGWIDVAGLGEEDIQYGPKLKSGDRRAQLSGQGELEFEK